MFGQFTYRDMAAHGQRAIRRTRPSLVGDVDSPASTAGLYTRADRFNAFSSRRVGVAVPLDGNPDSIIYIGKVGM